MKIVFTIAITVLVALFVRELYIYFGILKNPKRPHESCVDWGKMDFDKSLNYPKQGSEIDIKNWDVDSQNINDMFLGCKYLTTVSCSDSLDLSNWDTSDITSMVTIKNAAYLDYCKENGLEVHRFNFVETGLITYAKETEHPSLFDGSLD